jgi:amino acid adenylation domain-containing protein
VELFSQEFEIASGCERIIFGRLLRDSRDTGCSLSYTFDLRGTLNVEALERGLRDTVIDFFPDLLCRFEEREGVVVRRLAAMPASFLEIVRDDPDCTSHAAEDVLAAERCLFRFRLVVVSAAHHLLCLNFSHLVFDGECYLPFVRRLSETLGSPQRGCGVDCHGTHRLPSERVVPDDADISEDAAFWQKRLAGRRLGQRLGFLAGGDASNDRFVSVRRTISGDEFSALRRFLDAEKTTLFRFIAAALAVAVFHYDADDHPDGIAIAHTVSLRRRPEASGCFANVLPLFVPACQDWTPREILSHVRDERRATRPHQRLPLPDLIAFADERINRNIPTLNLIVNESQGLLPIEAFAMGGIQVGLIGTPKTGGPFDLGVTFSHDEASLRLSIDSPAALASRPLVVRFADSLLSIIAWFVEHPDEPVSKIDLSRPMVPVAHGATAVLPGDEVLLERIFAHARTRSGQVAVRFDDVALTYADLASAVAGLVARIEAATDPAALHGGIGIALQRSAQLPIAMLAALALGVPFVPLEQSLPPERLDHILETTALSVVVCDVVTATEMAARRPELTLIDVAGCDGGDQVPLARPVSSNLAYLLFTSGSTGLPKGVAITRRNLLNFMFSMVDTPGFTAHDRFLALTPISFDISILELLLPLFVGAEVRIVDDATRRCAADLVREIADSGVNVVQATPATWRMLKGEGWVAARPLTVLCGGEALTQEIADYLLDQGHRLYNMYGPTEATIWASCVRIAKGEPIHLGTPVLNTRFNVVDASLRSVVDGQPGELLIEGECVGDGYLRNDSAAFVTLDGGRRAYRTGDIVRALGDGRVVYVGRRDNQRKINGYRVELDEVSMRVRTLIGDADVFTVVREHPSPHLCTFYLPRNGGDVDASRVLETVRRALPAYMVPAALVRLDALPLTPNGKVDLKHLALSPVTEAAAHARVSDPARIDACPGDGIGTTQGTLSALASSTLGMELNDPHASLGWLGLNSISYNLLAQAIDKAFGVRISPHRFYELNTLAAMATEIDRLRGTTSTPPIGADAVHGEDGASTVRSAGDAGKRSISGGDAKAIAIIGQSVLMPGGMEADAFWNALMRREHLIVERTRSGFGGPIHAGFLDDIEGFDAKFFSISPLEANHMDPRQRLLLQTTWRAIEDAGYAASTLSERNVGCYIAATGADYATLQARAGNAFTPYSLSGNSLSILANRISSFFNWSGPSTTIDTACSGSLSAIVKACRDLSGGVCEAALVGAINVIADDQISRGLEVGNFMSPRYRCATFDEDADGYVRGEGVACFLLKRLSDAIADGDPVHGVIVGYGENHGGRSTSLTAPNPAAQTRLLTDVYTPELAARVSYIETHGTGTRLGDPIEIDALKAAWKRLSCPPDGRKVWLGAVKSNIGHLEPAAGAASLAKVLLAMRHGVLPPNNHFHRLNPLISFEDSPFSVLASPVDWPADVPRLAGISSFGFGGSNAHIVVSDPPARAVGRAENSHVLVTLSSRSATAFASLRKAMREHLIGLIECGAPVDLESMACTLNVGRTHFECRAAWIVASLSELVDALARDDAPVRIPPRTSNEPDKAVADESRLDRLDRLRSGYLRGHKIDWREVHRGDTQRIHLPTYRFDAQPFWFCSERSAVPNVKIERQTNQELMS